MVNMLTDSQLIRRLSTHRYWLIPPILGCGVPKSHMIPKVLISFFLVQVEVVFYSFFFLEGWDTKYLSSKKSLKF